MYRVRSGHEKFFTKFTQIYGSMGTSNLSLSGLAEIVQNQNVELTEQQLEDWVNKFDEQYEKCKNELKQALIDLKTWKEDVLDFLEY